ncbi:hypothetical protein ILYODFUR_038831, partial [Ilyodon furcidens]
PDPAPHDTVKSRLLNGLFEDLLTTLPTLSEADKSHRSMNIRSCKHTPMHLHACMQTITGYHIITHSTSIFSISIFGKSYDRLRCQVQGVCVNVCMLLTLFQKKNFSCF